MQRDQGQARVTTQSHREGVQGVRNREASWIQQKVVGDLGESSFSGAMGTAPDCSGLRSEWEVSNTQTFPRDWLCREGEEGSVDQRSALVYSFFKR